MELPRRPDANDTDSRSRSMPSGTPRRTWAGRGTNESCDFCRQTIRPEQVEYEVELQGSTSRVLHLHFECYQAWMITARRARP